MEKKLIDSTFSLNSFGAFSIIIKMRYKKQSHCLLQKMARFKLFQRFYFSYISFIVNWLGQINYFYVIIVCELVWFYTIYDEQLIPF